MSYLQLFVLLAVRTYNRSCWNLCMFNTKSRLTLQQESTVIIASGNWKYKMNYCRVSMASQAIHVYKLDLSLFHLTCLTTGTYEF